MKKLIGITVIFFATMAVAFEPSVPNPQQVKGQDTTDSCGIGWDITDSVTIMGTSTRAVTNYFLPPAFSMTSGTSGCAPHEIAKNEVEAVKFAATNFDDLNMEMAQGQGEYLSGLAGLMGCDSATFGKMAQENYGNIVAETPIDTYKNIKREAAVACNVG